jgi:hypothetical protein
MYGDPKRLYALATEVERKEEHLRHRVAALRDVSHATQWKSVAGATHRAHLDHDLRSIEGCADRLGAAAGEIRKHAATVERRLHLIADAERHVRDWFAHAEKSVVERVEGAVTALEHMVTGPAPWASWPWSPHTLPAPGHVEWLEVAEYVRRSPWQP